MQCAKLSSLHPRSRPPHAHSTHAQSAHSHIRPHACQRVWLQNSLQKAEQRVKNTCAETLIPCLDGPGANCPAVPPGVCTAAAHTWCCMTACNCAAHAMPPATGAFTEGVGPGDGCSRAGRAFLGMSCVLERVVPHPKGFNSGSFPPQPLGRSFVVRANFVGKKKAKKC